MSLVSQLDGGFHVQYFAYEWTIVQAITWPYQTFWSIFWVFFTSELSSVMCYAMNVPLSLSELIHTVEKSIGK